MSIRKKVKIEKKLYSLTKSMSLYLSKLEICLKLNYGICVFGPPGSGKSSLIRMLSDKHDQELLSVYLDSSIDSKSLLGTYICGETPGEFTWKTGILVQAALKGSWVVFENLDRMNEDIKSLLSNLIHTNKLNTPNKPQQIIPAQGFKIFATASTAFDTSKWVTIQTKPFTTQDLWEISPIARISDTSIQTALINIHLCMNSIKGRPLVSNDWIKFSKRVNLHIERIYGKKGVVNNILTEACKELVFLETMGIYSGTRDIKDCIRALSSTLDLNYLQLEAFYENRTIKLTPSPKGVQIGISPELESTNPISLDLGINNYTLKILEKISTAIAFNEPVLLVGETGCGKTSIVQYISKVTNTKLYVHNLSQVSDSADIVGGFKPIAISSIISPLVTQFFHIIQNLQGYASSSSDLNHVRQYYSKKKWEKVLEFIIIVLKDLLNYNQSNSEFLDFLKIALDTQKKLKNSQFAFQFVEGSLVKAIKEGSWVLLEEINLAEEEVLERLHSVLEGQSITLLEKAEAYSIALHPNFRIFGCMNPGRQIGKKNLPDSLRSKFTEIWVPEMEKYEDVLDVVKFYLDGKTDRKTIENVAAFYLDIRKHCKEGLIETGCGKVPEYSMRTLCRSLKYALEFSPHYSFPVSLYNGLKVFFETPLTYTLDTLLTALSPAPSHALSSLCKTHTNIFGYYHEKGPKSPIENPYFIITASVKANLTNLSRAIIYDNNAILLEGPTSSGKTSMIEYLAGILGHEFVRINNHEHTDIEEYIGSYVSDNQGRLVFCEGPLVAAVKNGHYLVLDELNLAPSEVLEALNRLLDDNKELFITETQTTIKPHKNFRLFATQNPVAYAGRKELSKAFRNRFVEMYVNELPDNELIQILETKGKLAPSYAQVLICIMKDLQRHRQQTRAFLGKQGFITIRDLLKIAAREPIGYEQLGYYSYMILAERLRTTEEKELVQNVIQKYCKNIKINMESFYDTYFNKMYLNKAPDIVWNRHMKRLFCLVTMGISNNEPVLLIGETGCGKTSICQALSQHNNINLRTINCHQHTETSDFLGTLRPVRNRNSLRMEVLNELKSLYNDKAAGSTLEDVYKNLKEMKIEVPETLLLKIRRGLKLFEWVDGPLVEAFNNGEYFLIDEISLADDSVLERLNSVLESERKLLIPEKAGEGHIEMIPKQGFQVFATMNPGGDYGKKELSPALRNRFTEIWVSITIEDIEDILKSKLPSTRELVNYIKDYNLISRIPISLRDAITCANFMNLNNSLWESLSLILPTVPNTLTPSISYTLFSSNEQFGILPYTIPRSSSAPVPYAFSGPRVLKNLYSLLRGMQINKAILLEGPPGVGKTSIIEALGKVIGHTVVRVNLSEETDLIDLLGCDLPAGNKFHWCDGILLNAIKHGHWLILDELNLCPQQVIEGLNSLLDHRATVFIPEINLEVKSAPGFRLFAAQNPVNQGGGRKGLPKSFLNRFTKIYMEELTSEDYLSILSNLFPNFPNQKIVDFNAEMKKQINGPWEFNLRDILRYCEGEDILTLYYYRLRTDMQRETMKEIYNATYNTDINIPKVPFYRITEEEIIIEDIIFPKINIKSCSLELLPSQLTLIHRACLVLKKNSALLIVGKKSSGKNTIARVSSILYNKNLLEYSLSPNTDSSQLLGSFEQTDAGSFEWQESLLVKAIKNGDWVLLKNCNTCPSAVLDRINSLLEPNGKLLINERGLVDGETYIVAPHPDFRIIFSYSPQSGEVSRALRNRCIELYLDNEYTYYDISRLFALSMQEYQAVKDSGLEELSKWKELSKIVQREEGYRIVYGPYEFMDTSIDFYFESFESMFHNPLAGYWQEDQRFIEIYEKNSEALECFISNSCLKDVEERCKHLTMPSISDIIVSLGPWNEWIPIISLSNDLKIYLIVSLALSKVPHDLNDPLHLKSLWIMSKCVHPYTLYKLSRKLPSSYFRPSPIDIGLLRSWKYRLGLELASFKCDVDDFPSVLTCSEFSQLVSGGKVTLHSNRIIVNVIDEDNNETEIGILASKESYQSEERVFLSEVHEIYEEVLFRHLIECMDDNVSYELALNLYPKSYLKSLWVLQNSSASIRDIVLPLLKIPATPPLDFVDIYTNIKNSSILDAPKYWFIGNNLLQWPRPKIKHILPKKYIELLVQELNQFVDSDETIQNFLNTKQILGLGLWLYKLYIKTNIDPNTLYIDLKKDYENLLTTVQQKKNIRNHYYRIRNGWEVPTSITSYYTELLSTLERKIHKLDLKILPRKSDMKKFIEEVSKLPSYSR